MPTPLTENGSAAVTRTWVDYELTFREILTPAPSWTDIQNQIGLGLLPSALDRMSMPVHFMNGPIGDFAGTATIGEANWFTDAWSKIWGSIGNFFGNNKAPTNLSSGSWWGIPGVGGGQQYEITEASKTP